MFDTLGAAPIDDAKYNMQKLFLGIKFEVLGNENKVYGTICCKIGQQEIFR
jgi:hypothetical protein